MRKPSDPRELAVDLLSRSSCTVQVAAVLTDATGNIMSWGWNHSGPNGLGQHAEHHAMLRVNRNRLWHGSVYVAGRRRRGPLVNAKPCKHCQTMINNYDIGVFYRNKHGDWVCS